MKQDINICLLEDSEIVRDLLVFTIENNIDCKVHSVDLKNPLKNVLDIQPDIIILDYSLDYENQSINSIKILEQIGQKLSDVPVIIFSGQTDLTIASTLLKKGAIDYVSKNTITFHDDIIHSITNALQFRLLSKQKKNQRKKQLKRIKKIVSLALIISTLLILILTLTN
ncbi:MAG: DNA-binding NtrC family response regulator [Psychroserpens sp.]|jgi:DNA-binding NtrC family response regulator